MIGKTYASFAETEIEELSDVSFPLSGDTVRRCFSLYPRYKPVISTEGIAEVEKPAVQLRVSPKGL